MDAKLAVVFLILVVVVVLVVLLSQGGGACASGNKKNFQGFKTWLTEEPAVGAEEPMDHTEKDHLRSPLFPMRQILEQLALVEDHCAYRRRCYECIAKHMMAIEAWADFGGSLAGEATDDYGKIAQSVSEKLTEVRRLGMLKSRLGPWAKELYAKIRAAYPELDREYNRLEELEIEEVPARLLPLRLPHFNLREIAKLLILMEITTAHPDMRCAECLRYLLTKAAALAKEGSEMTPALRGEYERVRAALDGQLASLLDEGIGEETSQWFRAERKRLVEDYPELHEQGIYKNYDKPVYLAKCGESCS